MGQKTMQIRDDIITNGQETEIELGCINGTTSNYWFGNGEGIAADDMMVTI